MKTLIRAATLAVFALCALAAMDRTANAALVATEQVAQMPRGMPARRTHAAQQRQDVDLQRRQRAVEVGRDEPETSPARGCGGGQLPVDLVATGRDLMDDLALSQAAKRPA